MRVSHQSGNNPEVANSKKGGRAIVAGEVKRSEIEDGTSSKDNSDVKTEISTKSKEYATAKAVAKNAPDVRAEKVAELKRRIAEKSYKVDTAAVADKLVDEHLRMPDRD